MKKNGLYAGLLGALALVVFLASMAHYVFPGESAELIACWRGLADSDAVRYPLMAVFAKALGGGNLIAPISGALAVVLMFLLVTTFMSWRMHGEKSVPQRQRLSHIAGAVASIVFIFSPAVRSAATHLEPRLFDFTWALLAFALILPIGMLSSRYLFLYPILLGVMMAYGLMDSPLVLAFAPFYVALVIALYRSRKKQIYLPLFLLVASGLLTFFTILQGFGLEFSGLMRSTAKAVRLYHTVSGWMFVTIFTTVPFITSLFSSASAFNKKPTFAQWAFHSAMTFVSILAIATPLSPSALMEPYGILPVATSAFAAATAGYLVAYWWYHRDLVIGLVEGGVLAFVLLVTVIWNVFAFDGNQGAFADKVANKILRDLGKRKWFVTDGVIDDHLKLAAARAGKDLRVISLSRDLDESYLTRLSEIVKKEGIGGAKNGELCLSLTLGVLPFLQDWFAADPTIAQEVAIYGAPDLWYSANVTPVPEFLFFGADRKIEPDWDAWKEFDGILKAPKGWGSYHGSKSSNPVDRMRLSIRRHIGFVANNRGVYLQDQRRDDEAFKMYDLVLDEIDHDNICAIFNEVGMVGAKHPAALQKQRELERMLKAAVEDTNRRYLLWRLGTYYGYIRNPELFIRLGHTWARSGRPGDAMSQIRRAIDFIPTDKRAVLLNMMAALYANENEQRKSRTLYESVLAKDARDHDALIGLMRLELLDGNSKRALEYLERAAETTADGKRAKIELAMVAMMKNDLTKAKELIKKATDTDPKDMQAWSLLAATVMQQMDAAKDAKAKAALLKELNDQIVPMMEKQARDPYDYHLTSTKAFVKLRQGEDKRREARDLFAKAAKVRPDINATQDLILGLDISLDDKVHAEAQARDVLRRNRNAPLANYVMGSLALTRGEYAEAEAFLRKAADAPQPVVFALNDLAEVLRRNHNYSEAERYARQAVKRSPDLYVAWETLGSVLMDAGRNLDEAESAIRKACELSRAKDGHETDIRMLVSLARVQIKTGDKKHARVTIRKVQARLGELSDFERHEFEEFLNSAR